MKSEVRIWNFGNVASATAASATAASAPRFLCRQFRTNNCFTFIEFTQWKERVETEATTVAPSKLR